MRSGSLKVGVVGATGMVGQVLLERLESRRFPVGELRPFSSGKSNAAVSFLGRRVPAPAISFASLSACELVFLVSSDEISLKFGRKLAAAGVWVIDDSAAFRMEKDVPLLIPEVNEKVLTNTKRLIAGPNCTTAGLALALKPLYESVGLSSVRAASYQAVSGAGREALLEFYSQLRFGAKALDDDRPLVEPKKQRPSVFPEPIAMNVFPRIGSLDGNGEFSEELKVRRELRKLFSDPKLHVSVSAVRVPVVRGHSLAVWAETRRPLSVGRAKALFAKAPGVRLMDGALSPTPLDASGKDETFVGRVRGGASSKELAFWVVSDNLLKGAALNSVQIAELLLRRGWLAPGKRGTS